MYNFTVSPNLPKNAKYILIGEKYFGLLANKLEHNGRCPVPVHDNPNVDARLSGHIDLSVLHGGGERVYLAPHLRNTALERRLALMGAEIVFPNIVQSEKYPNDSQLNVCVVGDVIFYSKNVSCAEIVSDFSKKGYRTVSIKQGYCGCSICPVDEKSIICSDDKIADAALNNGFDVLKISPGHIKLEGYEYGFIGGACFKLSERKLAFTGRLDSHPDEAEIMDFISDRSIDPVFLSDMPLFDIGGAIPLTEQ